jgi:hypothetical protein
MEARTGETGSAAMRTRIAEDSARDVQLYEWAVANLVGLGHPSQPVAQSEAAT